MNFDKAYWKYQAFKFGIFSATWSFYEITIVKFTYFYGHFGGEAVGSLIFVPDPSNFGQA